MATETERHRRLVRDLLSHSSVPAPPPGRLTEYARRHRRALCLAPTGHEPRPPYRAARRAKPPVELHTLIAEVGTLLLDTGPQQHQRNLNGHCVTYARNHHAGTYIQAFRS